MHQNHLALPTALALAFLASTPALPRELTVRESDALVRLAVQHQIAPLPWHGPFSLESLAREDDPRFSSFEALGVWTANEGGSAVLGNYSVNRATAEVWDLSSCTRIAFRALVKMQKRYRARLALSPPTAFHPPNC